MNQTKNLIVLTEVQSSEKGFITRPCSVNPEGIVGISDTEVVRKGPVMVGTQYKVKARRVATIAGVWVVLQSAAQIHAVLEKIGITIFTADEPTDKVEEVDLPAIVSPSKTLVSGNGEPLVQV